MASTSSSSAVFTSQNQNRLETKSENDMKDNILCPTCKTPCVLPSQEISRLISDCVINNEGRISEYAISNEIETPAIEDFSPSCTSCTAKAIALSYCCECKDYLCQNCARAHEFMYCFETHHVARLKELSVKDKHKECEKCSRHVKHALKFYCSSCNTYISEECTTIEQSREMHDCKDLLEIGHKEPMLEKMLTECKTKIKDLNDASEITKEILSYLRMSYRRTLLKIDYTYKVYSSMLHKRKEKLRMELDEFYFDKTASLTLMNKKIGETVTLAGQMSSFIDNILKFSNNLEITTYQHLLSKARYIMSYNPKVSKHLIEFKFICNYQAIHASVERTFGYIQYTSATDSSAYANTGSPAVVDSIYKEQFEANNLDELSSIQSSEILSANDFGYYKKWPDADKFERDRNDDWQVPEEPAIDFSYNFLPRDRQHLKTLLQRRRFSPHCIFGGQGSSRGKFAELSGIAINAQNEIIVTDVLNHRIQIFDKEGKFKFLFGVFGKKESEVLHPHRIAVYKETGDIVFSERKMFNRIQIYNQHGQFIRKCRNDMVRYSRALAVDKEGRIIVVESKTTNVTIFDMFGEILHTFNCMSYLKFPHGAAVNDKQEIFICDNALHCVKVFNYEGIYLRQIGGTDLTYFPIGVCINKNGEVLVADNYYYFKITVFTQDGQLTNAFESPIKHQHCCAVDVMDDMSIVVACKDCQLYIYRCL